MRHLPLFLAILASCRSLSSSDLRVTNPVNASDKYPEVVMLTVLLGGGELGTCTGTFVTKRIILTAAHCFFNEKGSPVVGVVYKDNKGVNHWGEMTASANFDRTKGLEFSQQKKDLGVLSFSEDLAPAVAKTERSTLVVNQKIKLVGYGATDAVTPSDYGKKNMGESTIHSIKENIIISLGYASTPSSLFTKAGTSSASALGDSGGAVFNERDELIGVIRGGGFTSEGSLNHNTAKASSFIDLAHPFSFNVMTDIAARDCRGEHLQ